MPVRQPNFLVKFDIIGSVPMTDGTLRAVVNSLCVAVVDQPYENDRPKIDWAFFVAQPLWYPVLQLLHRSYNWESCTVSFPRVLADRSENFVFSLTGSVFGERLPLNCALYAGLETDSRGRSYRGTKRLAPLAAEQFDGDRLTPAAEAAWADAIAPFAVPTFFPGIEPTFQTQVVVWSQQLQQQIHEQVLWAGDFVTSTYIDPFCSSWRHRRERTPRAP